MGEGAPAATRADGIRRVAGLVAVLLLGGVAACAGPPESAPPSPPPGPASVATSSPLLPPTTGPPLTTPPVSTPPTTTTRASRPTPPEHVDPFTDRATLAEALATAEVALADPTTPADERARWAWVQQQAYRDLAAHPSWQPAARRRIPTELEAAFDLNLRAVTSLRALTAPQAELPDWTIVAPPSVAELRRSYNAATESTGVPWSVLAAIHLVETRFGRIRGASPAGARGPMQFMPATWEAYGEGDIMDPADAVAAAARYLVAHGAPDDMAGALYAYNHSRLYVDAVLAHAEAMERYDHYLVAYHAWRVFYRTPDGDVLLEEGWPP